MKKTKMMMVMPQLATLLTTKLMDNKEESKVDDKPEQKTPYEVYQSFSQEEKDEFKLGV